MFPRFRSAFSAVDPACLIAAILFVVSDIIMMTEHLSFRRSQHFNFKSWKSLDPEYIRASWESRLSSHVVITIGGLLGAAAWFALCVPVLNAAWVLSCGGKRKVAVHSLVCVLAMGGSVTELTANLLLVGAGNVGNWIAKAFNLDDWTGEGSGDGMGWRVLELTQLFAHGLIIWVDAIEFLAIFGIMVLLFLSVRAEGADPTFSRCWSILGLVIGLLSLFDFLAAIMRLQNWRVYSFISLTITILNAMILLPSWLLVLGCQLPKARAKFEGEEADSLTHRKEDGFSDEGEGSVELPQTQVI